MSKTEPDAADTYDVIVLGAGAGGMAAAVVAANEGLDTLLLEKTEYVGGTTAVSGGMVWVPNNAKMAGAGLPDALEEAQKYLDATAGAENGDTDSAELRRVFLDAAPDAIDYLDRNSQVQLVPLTFYPDYYPDLPGATQGGRVLEPMAFDARELGESFKMLRPPLPEFTLLGGMMVARPDIVHFRRIFKSPLSVLRVARLVAAYAWQRTRLHRGANLVLGNALAGRLLKSLLLLGVEIRRNTVTRRLLEEDGRITGVEIETPGGVQRIKARRGVVLAAGGFSHDAALRGLLLPSEAGMHSAAAPGNTGDGVNLASRIEGLTRFYGVPLIISESAAAAAPEFIYRELDRVRVKGKLEPVRIFEPLEAGILGDGELESYHEALAHYRAREWRQADDILAGLAAAAPASPLYALYRQRIANFLITPPADDWDATVVHSEK